LEKYFYGSVRIVEGLCVCVKNKIKKGGGSIMSIFTALKQEKK